MPLMKELGVTGTSRASFYFYNTMEEVDLLIASIEKVKSFFGVGDGSDVLDTSTNTQTDGGLE